ncbi:MAG: hypothetical protein CL804_02305 [Citromicrobium sp.]|nr:hypothetical protein [Citromicrobium sp.]
MSGLGAKTLADVAIPSMVNAISLLMMRDMAAMLQRDRRRLPDNVAKVMTMCLSEQPALLDRRRGRRSRNWLHKEVGEWSTGVRIIAESSPFHIGLKLMRGKRRWWRRCKDHPF